MSYKSINLEWSGHVAILTINRPEKLNALDWEASMEFHDALDEVGKRFPDVRALILTGTGRAFSSGADLTATPRSDEALARQDENHLRPRTIAYLAPRIRELPQPVIAAVNGVAAGAGFSIALASDMRIASEAARFTTVFIKRGLIPDTGASYNLPALVGPGIAAEMALTGNIYDAQWALRTGLVNRVVPADELMSAANALAQDVASNPPIVVAATKRLLYQFDPNLLGLIPNEHATNRTFDGTEDKIEATAAFREKRTPVFTGR